MDCSIPAKNWKSALGPGAPIGMGYLRQKLDAQTKFDPKSDLRSGFDRFRPESITANKQFVDRITELAKRKDATTARVTAYCLVIGTGPEL